MAGDPAASFPPVDEAHFTFVRSTLAHLLPFAILGSIGLGCSANDGTPVGSSTDAGIDVSEVGVDGPSLDSPFVDAAGCLEDGSLITLEPDEDHDGDGWSVSDGDCNDCDINANPGAYDVADNGVDEDCSGEADDEVVSCDQSIALLTNVPEDGARAIGLCRLAKENPTAPTDRSWGVVASSFVLADGTVGMNYASRGVLADFGPNVRPQEGSALLALSSAAARRPGDSDYTSPIGGDMGTSAPTPTGWPRDFPSCPQPIDPIPVANDSAALSLRIRVPTNAHALSFRFSFYTTEFPAWVCHQYNDYFVALLASSADNPLMQGGNISFDGQGNPISVNTALLDVCRPQVVDGKPFGCSLGDAALAGNGFGPSSDEPRGHGATGWLETSAAVVPGELIELRFAIWDAGDHTQGSTVLIDDFRWRAEEGVEVGTVRVPSPK
jgi:hypothetical protein